MEIEKLKKRQIGEPNKKLLKEYQKMEDLIDALGKKEIPEELLTVINDDIKLVNSFPGTDKELTKTLRKTHSKILKFVEKELKLVAKNHYRTLWLAIGISVFGISMGTVFSAVLGNTGYIGMGIPIGMVIGLVIGANKDKYAEKERKQLDLDRRAF